MKVLLMTGPGEALVSEVDEPVVGEYEASLSLARRLEIPKEEATKFIEDYFARYPRVLAYQDDLLRKARQQGYVATILGRRRPVVVAGWRRARSHT